jgi:hypothetical protein
MGLLGELQHLISRANPRGSHIGVAPAVAPQQSKRSGICRQSDKAGYEASTPPDVILRSSVQTAATWTYPTESRLRGWACEIRTQKRRRKLSF